MANVPELVIQIENGIVAAVYWGDRSIMYAVVDLDEANWSDDYISLEYSQPLDELPPEFAAAIDTTLREET